MTTLISFKIITAFYSFAITISFGYIWFFFKTQGGYLSFCPIPVTHQGKTSLTGKGYIELRDAAVWSLWWRNKGMVAGTTGSLHKNLQSRSRDNALGE